MSPESVRRAVADLLAPRHFFAGESLALEWEAVEQLDTPWELFEGRLLPPSQTRQRQTFEAWNVFAVVGGVRSTEPLLSVKLDVDGALLHVTRGLLCRVHEPFDSGGAIETREVERWVSELVGTLRLELFRDLSEFQDELTCRLFQAVVGTSRLPLTSLEAPLPEFTLGRLGYFVRPDGNASVRPPSELLRDGLGNHLTWLEKAKLLEAYLRAIPPEEVADAAERFLTRWLALGHASADVCDLLRAMFNEVSLSPWTGLVDAAVTFLRSLERRLLLSAADVVDVLAALLRQVGRHLTAFDLVTFHHQGANYPDALLLDALLKALLELAECHPALFLGGGDRERLRRRALRQGWLLRRRYEGHRVPDAPTSPGENVRVLPGPHVRVPEEQIYQPHRRPRRLFAGDPLDARLGEHCHAALRASVADLRDPRELRELGTALFLERPLGMGKRPTEPDQTPLFSHVACSPTIARHRLDLLAGQFGVLREAEKQSLEARGLPVPRVKAGRPGVVSLADAWRVADDFVLLRTTGRTVDAFRALYDLGEVRPALIVGDADLPGVRLYDDAMQPQMELVFDPARGYESRGGVEYPVGGLRVAGQGGILRARDGWLG